MLGTEMTGTSRKASVCALSIDLESFVHRSSHREPGRVLDTECRKRLDQRYIEKATLYILHLLEQHRRKVTFFVVSEIFDWYPDIVKRVAEEGHEIAHHTHTHTHLHTKQDLATELRQSWRFIREFRPVGFRAPDASINAEQLKILGEYGFEYDSSSFGNLNMSRTVFGLREIPVSTFGFFRRSSALHLPRDMTRTLLSGELPLGSGLFMSALGHGARVLPHVLATQNEVPVLFIHPWQIVTHDDNLPIHEKGFLRRTASVLYSQTCQGSFIHLLTHFQTVRLRDLLHRFPTL